MTYPYSVDDCLRAFGVAVDGCRVSSPLTNPDPEESGFGVRFSPLQKERGASPVSILNASKD
jgi:hypothetical protein